MSRKIKIDKTMPKPRNPMAMIVRKQFHAVKFDHKSTERGGDRNIMADLSAECDEDRWEQYDCD